jgi:hypothetical protein
MAQIFRPSTNTLARLSIVGGGILVVVLLLAIAGFVYSSFMTGVGVARRQPIPFSHKHHVADAGIDCRYCHTSVEEAAFAGIPSTKTCMNCHTQIWADSPILEPVRESWRTGRSLEWLRVHKLADFVYFNHSIHVKKGLGCATCHGPVDRMPLMYQQATLQMSWCLDCHRNPAQYLRPREEVYNMNWQRPANDPGMGERLVKDYKIASVEQLTSCSTCHR